jgi:hypothetical protein
VRRGAEGGALCNEDGFEIAGQRLESGRLDGAELGVIDQANGNENAERRTLGRIQRHGDELAANRPRAIRTNAVRPEYVALGGRLREQLQTIGADVFEKLRGLRSTSEILRRSTAGTSHTNCSCTKIGQRRAQCFGKAASTRTASARGRRGLFTRRQWHARRHQGETRE